MSSTPTPSPAPTTTCNAIDRKTKQPCKKPAGQKTQHVGYGRCWKHGGKSTHLVLPRAATLKELVNLFRQDKEIYNLRNEIAVSRAVTQHLQNLITDEDEVDEVNALLKTLNLFLNTSGKLIEKMHDIEEGRKYIISVDEVKKVMDDFVNIIIDEVQDPVLQEKILNRIINTQVQDAINIPPENWKYSDDWAKANTPVIDYLVPENEAEDLIRDVIDYTIEQPQETTQESDAPERLSLRNFPSRLQIDPQD